MPPLNDDQQRRTQRLAEQRAATTQGPPEVQRANDRAEIIQSPLNLMENARKAMQRGVAESLLAQVAESQRAETAALDVYQAYRQMYPELPTMPPRGLQVALHPASVKKVGGHPLIVTLNTSQLEEDAGKPAPRFLADPHLALDSPPVAKALMNAGMDKISYTAAQKLQRPGLLPMYQAQISHREESSAHTSTSQPTQPHNPYATSTVASILAQAEESLTAETAALDVYQAHRQMYPDLPTMPPPGLQVALHPASVGKVGGDPLIVTLNTPQLKEDFGKPAPRFLADPHLALDSPPVAKALMNVVVDKDSYTVARGLQKMGLLQEYQAQVLRREESSAHTPPSQPTQPHNPYATSAAAYLPTTPGTGQHSAARTGTTQPTSGPAGQPFGHSPAAPANRPAPGR